MKNNESWDNVGKDVKDIMNSKIPYQFASFTRRILSALIDLVIIYIILNFMGQTKPISSGIIGFDADIYGVLVILSYSIILEWLPLQATLGKMIFGLKVTDCETRKITFFHSVGRTWAKFITAITLLLGFMTIFFTSKNQSLHDLVSKSLVLRDPN